jgi:hypothetical protein
VPRTAFHQLATQLCWTAIVGMSNAASASSAALATCTRSAASRRASAASAFPARRSAARSVASQSSGSPVSISRSPRAAPRWAGLGVGPIKASTA